MQQQMLESNTEALSGLTEKETLTIEDREYITNLTTVTHKFLDFMMKFHHDDTTITAMEEVTDDAASGK
jgi:hypothetical protein